MFRKCLLCVLGLCPLTSLGKTIYVDDTANGANDGSSWFDAYVDLQNAIRASRPGDEIWVAEGIYVPTQDARRRTAFELISGVKHYGGFKGTEVTLQERDWRRHKTTLSGNIGDDGKRVDNSVHII